MGYIYCIENLINHKKYVGKTCFTIQKRWERHVIDARKGQSQNRPLYKAFNKYGIENFQIFQLEECDNNILNEREQYWIQELHTFHTGYNATLGGEGGKIFEITYNELWNFYKAHKIPKEIAAYYGCSTDLITDYSKEYGIHWHGHTQRHDIDCYLNNQYVRSFFSAGEAASWIISEGLSNAQIDSISVNIMRCCKGTRLSCYGFSWTFKDIPVV